MKKWFFFAGLVGVGYSFYYFFKKQFELALSLDYKIKNLKFLELTTSKAKVDITVNVSNKSSFQIEVLEYDLTFKYKGIPIASTQNFQPIVIKADSSFDVNAIGNIDFLASKSALLPFVKDALAKQPINIQVNGYVKVKFLNINRALNFTDEEFVYSQNILEELKLADDVEKLKTWATNIFR